MKKVLTFIIVWLLLAKPAFAVTNYSLPYPGIGPDNFFWSLKDFRDKFIGLFIFDPVARGQYFLFQADKRIAMVKMSKSASVKELSTKLALDYFNAAMAEEERAKNTGFETGPLLARIFSAAKSYEEITGEKEIVSKVKERILARF